MALKYSQQSSSPLNPDAIKAYSGTFWHELVLKDNTERIVKTANVIILITRDSAAETITLDVSVCHSLPIRSERWNIHMKMRKWDVYVWQQQPARALDISIVCSHTASTSAQDEAVWSLNLIKYTFSLPRMCDMYTTSDGWKWDDANRIYRFTL